MHFTKMHGIGNDYIYVNCLIEKIENPNELSRILSDRHFGIGSDGLVLIEHSNSADFKMSMYNSDGSQAEMCGNAIRCVGKFVYDNKLTNKTKISVETLAGIKYLDMMIENGVVTLVKVDMGSPILISSQIPVDSAKNEFINQPVSVGGKIYDITCVSMGNPHAVIFMDDIDDLDIEKLGPEFENHVLFPKRINTEFIKVIDSSTIMMRVWERGAGETLACGTGACAATVASILCGYTDNEVEVKLLGGSLYIKWDREANRVYMSGSATKVFEGEI